MAPRGRSGGYKKKPLIKPIDIGFIGSWATRPPPLLRNTKLVALVSESPANAEKRVSRWNWLHRNDVRNWRGILEWHQRAWNLGGWGGGEFLGWTDGIWLNETSCRQQVFNYIYVNGAGGRGRMERQRTVRWQSFKHFSICYLLNWQRQSERGNRHQQQIDVSQTVSWPTNDDDVLLTNH